MEHLPEDDLVDGKGDEDVDDGGAEAAQIVAVIVREVLVKVVLMLTAEK